MHLRITLPVLVASLFLAPGLRADDGPSFTFEVRSQPSIGFTVTGKNFPHNDDYLWIAVYDETAHTQPVDGPDKMPFQAHDDGSFEVSHDAALTCGHEFSARLFINSVAVKPDSERVTLSCDGAPRPPVDTHSDPADHDASQAVRDAVAQLHGLADRDDKKLVIGQALRAWDGKGGPTSKPIDQPITDLTTKGLPAPKFIEIELTEVETGEHRDTVLSVLTDHAKAGGWVGATYHSYKPQELPADPADADDMADLASVTTKRAIAWRNDLDDAYATLSELQNRGIFVFFRPLHESNGNWFWWGLDTLKEPEEFIGVWRGAFKYLTEQKGLHNLVWVYAANRSESSNDNPTDRYPGDEYVDMVGLDIYDDALSDAENNGPGYDALLKRAPSKPFAITEYGSFKGWYDYDAARCAYEGHDANVVLPNDKVLQIIKDKYKKAVLASAWYSTYNPKPTDCKAGWNFQISDKAKPEALLLDAWSITR